MMSPPDVGALVPVVEPTVFVPTWLKLELRDCKRPSEGRSLLKYGNGELYLLELDGTLQTVDIYRLVAESPSLEKLASVPGPVGSLKGTTATIAGASLLFTGGYNSNTGASQICALDLHVFEWLEAKTLTRLPPRCRHSSTLVGSKTYVFGGLAVPPSAAQPQELGPHLSDLWALSLPGPDLVEVIAPHLQQPPARCDHAAAALDNSLIIVGGMGETGPLNDVWCFDTVLGAWQQLVVSTTHAPTSIVGWSAAAVGPQLLVVFGHSSGHSNQEVWLLHLRMVPGERPTAFWELVQATGSPPPTGAPGCIADCGDGCIFMLDPRATALDERGGCDLYVLALTEQAAARAGVQLAGLEAGMNLMNAAGAAGADKKRRAPGDAAPKKVTSYNIFCAEMRELVRTEHTTLNAREVEKMMGQRWAEMDGDRKRAYEEQARRMNAANAAAFAAQRSSAPSGMLPGSKMGPSPLPKKKVKTVKVEPLPRNQGASQPQPTTFQLFTPNPSLIGSSVEGQIDAVFNAGYLATVSVNGFTYRALLFSPYLALSVPMALQPTSGP